MANFQLAQSIDVNWIEIKRKLLQIKIVPLFRNDLYKINIEYMEKNAITHLNSNLLSFPYQTKVVWDQIYSNS